MNHVRADAVARRRDAVRAKLGPNARHELVAQVERVWRDLEGPDEPDARTTPDDLTHAFRTRGRIPQRLADHMAAARGTLDGPPPELDLAPEGLAIVFAASAHPQRASQMRDPELKRRAEALLHTLAAPQPLHDALLAEGRVPGLSPHDLPALLSDLAAAALVARANRTEAEIQRDMADRRAGAALYLATCYPAMAGRIGSGWRTEAAHARFLRSQMLSAPTVVAGRDSDNPSAVGRAYWDGVLADLARVLPSAPPEECEFAVRLEAMTWNEAQRWIGPARAHAGAQNFWAEMTTRRLASGFPYYAFRSALIYWWHQWVIRHRWRRDWQFDPLPADDIIEDGGELRARHVSAGLPELLELRAQELFTLREGYLLVRSTFYSGAGRSASPEQVARQNDRRRQDVDAIWHDEVSGRADDPTQLLPDPSDTRGVDDIDVNPNTVSTLRRRLHHRMWTYTKARIGGLADSEVRQYHPPGPPPTPGAPHAIDADPTCLAIAALARCVPPDRTILWAHTSRLFVLPKIDRHWPDPFDSTRYVRELWQWVIPDGFETLVTRSAGRVDDLASQALRGTPLGELVRGIQPRKSLGELDGHLAGTPPAELRVQSLAAFDLACRVAGPSGIHVDPAPHSRALSQWLKRVPLHWIVPIWYLAIAERLDGDALLVRLKPDPHDAPRVAEVAAMMARRLLRRDGR